MSRPLRIDYPGAWHHVMNRARRGYDLFLDKEDYELFISLLKETAGLFQMNIAAYCLMPNHYHMLVQSADGNLARCMRHINGVYTQKRRLDPFFLVELPNDLYEFTCGAISSIRVDVANIGSSIDNALKN
jgi:REP element-mobilizing transposase RayT